LLGGEPSCSTGHRKSAIGSGPQSGITVAGAVTTEQGGTAMTDQAATTQAEFPMSRTSIWLMCLFLTPLWGAVLYYAWRRVNLPAASYANRASWVSALLWMAGYVTYKLALR
jgi:hypothetical protein